MLIGFVKHDNIHFYLERSAKIYYTGRQFPSCIGLDELFYFMPYIKGKGIRDLYFINVVRVGTKQEVHPESNDTDIRLVFEIEYIRQLYNKFIPVHLSIWRTFTDATLSALVRLNEYDEII